MASSIAAEVKVSRVPLFIKRAMREYGTYVIEERAVPDGRDGLKPVQRRLLWTAHTHGLSNSSNFKKSARTVGTTMSELHPHGDCLAADTLVYSLDGKLRTIEEATERGKPLWVLAWDYDAGMPVPAKARAFRVGQYATRSYRITLTDGSRFEVTSNHPFLIRKRRWIKAENIRVGMELTGGGLLVDRDYPALAGLRTGILEPLHGIVTADDEDYSEVVHHKNWNPHDNRPRNLTWMTRAEHALEHGDYLDGLAAGRESMFAPGGKLRRATKIKNKRMMRHYNKTLYLRKALQIIAMIRADGKKPTRKRYDRYRGRLYNGTTLERLSERGHDFIDLLGMSESDIKMPGNVYGLTTKSKRTKDAPKPTAKGVSAKNHRMVARFGRLCARIYRRYGKVTWALYEEERQRAIQRTGLGLGNIHGRTYPTVQWLKDTLGTTPRKAMRAAGPSRILCVAKVEVIEHEERAMYDFTVRGHENMLLPAKNASGGYSFVVAHNSALYGAMVSMVHHRYPTFEGHGNFGTIVDPTFAAMRYTESRLSKIGDYLLSAGHVAETQTSYDGDSEEPIVIPARLPMLLLNGSEGIGVAITTNVPPHNMGEVVKAVEAYIKDPEDEDKVLGCLNGPDYGRGALMSEREDVLSVYTNGNGSLWYTCRWEVEDAGDHVQMVITSVPPRFSVETFITNLGKLIQDGRVEYAVNESTENVRIIVGLKNEADIRHVEESGYLDTSIPYSFYVKTPDGIQCLTLVDMIGEYVDFARTCETAVLEHEIVVATWELEKENARKAVAEDPKPLAQAMQGARNKTTLIKDLRGAYNISAKQAEYLTTCSILSLSRASAKAIMDRISRLDHRLEVARDNLSHLDRYIIGMLKGAAKQFGDERGTVLYEATDYEESDDWQVAVISKRGDLKLYDPDVLPASAPIPATMGITSPTDEWSAVITGDNRLHMYTGLPPMASGLKDVRALVDGTAIGILVFASNRRYVAVEMPVSKRDAQIIKGATKLDYAFPVYDGDRFAVVTDDSSVDWLTSDDLPWATRVGVQGKDYRYDIVSAYRVPQGAELLDVDGNHVQDRSIYRLASRGDLLVVGRDNVVVRARRVALMNMHEVKDVMGRGASFTAVLPVDFGTDEDEDD